MKSSRLASLWKEFPSFDLETLTTTPGQNSWKTTYRVGSWHFFFFFWLFGMLSVHSMSKEKSQLCVFYRRSAGNMRRKGISSHAGILSTKNQGIHLVRSASKTFGFRIKRPWFHLTPVYGAEYTAWSDKIKTDSKTSEAFPKKNSLIEIYSKSVMVIIKN